MRIVSEPGPARYQYGTDRAHTAGRCPPAYTPLADEAIDDGEPWTAEEAAEWHRAEMRDSLRESGGGW